MRNYEVQDNISLLTSHFKLNVHCMPKNSNGIVSISKMNFISYHEWMFQNTNGFVNNCMVIL